MLDFDGTLSPIVANPNDAVLPPCTKKILQAAQKHFPVAIISGRSLQDIRKRVGIDGIVYAGSHGFEWQIDDQYCFHPIPQSSQMALAKVAHQLSRLAGSHPGLILDSRTACFAINYRFINPAQQKRFKTEAQTIVRPFIKSGTLRLMDNIYTFEITPCIEWTKGYWARLMFDSFNQSANSPKVPIYIGDSITDEDVFEMFGNGITIHIGKTMKSAARFYLHDCEETAEFLAFIVSRVTEGKRIS